MHREKKKVTFPVFPVFCLRTPLFPLSFYTKLTKKTVLENADYLELLKNPILREAVYLASPELETQLKKWETGILTDTKKIKLLQFSLLKYASRISTRCTPFGLFASCASGEFANDCMLTFDKKSAHKRYTRFDMSFLSLLQLALLKNEQVRSHILFFPNTSLYLTGDHYRYIEYTFKNKKREYNLEGITYNAYMDTILQEAKTGKTLDTLASVLTDDEITLQEARGFIEQLIENQLLVSELELTITGGDYFQKLRNRLKNIPGINNINSQLDILNTQLQAIDVTIGNPVANYTKLHNTAKKLVPEYDQKFFLQTDSFSNLKKNTLDEAAKLKLQKAIPFFSRITISSTNSNIEKFKEDFSRRFEKAEIPLHIALDAEMGIGYGNPRFGNDDYLDDIPLTIRQKRYREIVWSDFDELMQQKLFEAYTNGQSTITLYDTDLETFPENWQPQPTFYTMVEVIPNKGGQKIFINTIGGTSAVNLMGRFTRGDKGLYSHIKEIFDFEAGAHADKIVAEIVHLPEARTGNILHRPNTRAYEIPYLGRSSLETSRQIPVNDLLVSIRNNRIVLRSEKLNKEVLPKLSNAHNYRSRALPVYHFLCDLQNQGAKSSIGFYWNTVFLKQPFLPRVEYEGLIIAKARWYVKVSDFEKLVNSNSLPETIKNWREAIKMPALTDLVEGDNRLLINFNNKDSVMMLFNSIRKKTYFVLEEFLFSDADKTDEHAAVYCNQYIISFKKPIEDR